MRTRIDDTDIPAPARDMSIRATAREAAQVPVVSILPRVPYSLLNRPRLAQAKLAHWRRSDRGSAARHLMPSHSGTVAEVDSDPTSSTTVPARGHVELHLSRAPTAIEIPDQ